MSQEELDEFRKRIEGLEPDERERVFRNLAAWERLPDELKNELRRRHRKMLSRLRSQVERLLTAAEAHDKMDPERKKEFFRAYARARQKMEREIQREAQQMRIERLPALLEELKEEFPEIQNLDVTDPLDFVPRLEEEHPYGPRSGER